MLEEQLTEGSLTCTCPVPPVQVPLPWPIDVEIVHYPTIPGCATSVLGQVRERTKTQSKARLRLIPKSRHEASHWHRWQSSRDYNVIGSGPRKPASWLCSVSKDTHEWLKTHYTFRNSSGSGYALVTYLGCMKIGSLLFESPKQCRSCCCAQYL